MLEILKLLVLGGTALMLTFLILLALPQCRLREIVMPFVSWGFVALCTAYALSPIDVLPEVFLGPFGLIDDVGAVIAAVLTAQSAIRTQREKSEAKALRPVNRIQGHDHG
jgi:uncharacterized membrane protein YkvA (DUF1232 family)